MVKIQIMQQKFLPLHAPAMLVKPVKQCRGNEC
jgi:hypothetical protein